MMNFDYLGAFIRSFRQANNESLQSLANRSGISKSMIAQIESGQKNPTIVVLAKLAQAMSISLEDFVKPPQHSSSAQRLNPCDENIISKQDSPFVCHLLAKKGALTSADFYRFYFKTYGKTSFSANPVKGTVKYIWIEQGDLTLYLPSEKIQLHSEQGLKFNATLPHRFENRQGELVQGIFTVIYS